MQLNLFQWIVLPIIFILLVERVIAVLNGRIRRRFGLVWVVLWLSAGVTVARPELTTRIARMVGIDRGTDLVLYVAVLTMFIGFYLTYVRLRRLHAQITQLVRHLAIQNALMASAGSPPPDAPDRTP